MGIEPTPVQRETSNSTCWVTEAFRVGCTQCRYPCLRGKLI